MAGHNQSNSGRYQASPAGMTERCFEEFESTVEEYPIATTLGVFAVGLILGVAAGAALGATHHSDRRRMAESLGKRVIDALQDYVPDNMRQYLPG